MVLLVGDGIDVETTVLSELVGLEITEFSGLETIELVRLMTVYYLRGVHNGYHHY